MTHVTWGDDVEEVVAGDLTACLAYATPAGGCVLTPVATVGLHDRPHGTVSFTTSLGFGKKLERIDRDPRIALAYHSRTHGFASTPSYVLVHGRASVDRHPDRALLESTVRPAAERFLGPAQTGWFWDRWLREYYQERVVVTVEVHRVVSWPDHACAGQSTLCGPAVFAEAAPQAPPKNGTAARVDAARAGRRVGALPHRLLGWLGGDGFPMVAPVAVAAGADRVFLVTSGAHLPEGGRRAGLLGHRYERQLVGLAVRQYTGWLDVGDGAVEGHYFPHTERSFRAPANKTLLLVANGLLAKKGLRAARRIRGPDVTSA
jgi:hypothetical protein